MWKERAITIKKSEADFPSFLLAILFRCQRQKPAINGPLLGRRGDDREPMSAATALR
jgi:hypothetical protein